MTLPNLISIARLFTVPFIVWLLIDGRYDTAFWLFLLAGLSDAVDGILARKLHMQSDLGGYLDPVADKTLMVSVYVTLGFMLEMPAYIVVAVVSRDILIIGAVMLSWIMDRPVAMKPLIISKANTVMQIVFCSLVLSDLAMNLGLANARLAIGYVVVGTTITSAVAYLVDWVAHMGEMETGE